MRTLRTERLILRDWQESDLGDFYGYAKVEGVGEMAGWRHHESKETSKEILDGFIRDADVYAIVLQENNKVIGSLGIHNRTLDPSYKAEVQREIGYVLSKEYWGNGFVTEAVREAIRYAFEELNVDVLWCGHYLINSQSQRVIEKSGFRFYSDHVFEATALNKTFDGKKYILLQEDWFMANENRCMTSDMVVDLYIWLKENGITIWIDGGWCIDALLGQQTREHADLDIAVHCRDNAKLRKLLENNDYKEVKRSDSSEFMYVMNDGSGKSVDIHAFEYDEKGNNLCGVEYPFGSLTGTGIINGQEVNCINPEFMFQFKTGYEPKEKDLHDIRALCERFGFEYNVTAAE